MAPVFSFVPFGSRPSPSTSGPVISCDGLVEGAELHLSHWEGNRTTPEWKADTSTEMAIRYALSGAPIGLVTNNHFDADGVLSVLALLEPSLAASWSSRMIGAAEAGDFDAWPENADGLKLAFAIDALSEGREEGEAYAHVLPMLPELITNLGSREAFYAEAFEALLEQDRRAASELAVSSRGGIVVFQGAEEPPGPVLDKRTPKGATRRLIAVDRGRGEHDYLYERPRHAWAETVARPKLAKPRSAELVRALGAPFSVQAASGMTSIFGTTKPAAIRPEALAERLLELDEGARAEVSSSGRDPF